MVVQPGRVGECCVGTSGFPLPRLLRCDAHHHWFRGENHKGVSEGLFLPSWRRTSPWLHSWCVAIDALMAGAAMHLPHWWRRSGHSIPSVHQGWRWAASHYRCELAGALAV